MILYKNNFYKIKLIFIFFQKRIYIYFKIK